MSAHNMEHADRAHADISAKISLLASEFGVDQARSIAGPMLLASAYAEIDRLTAQQLDAGLGDDAPLRVHVLDLAAKWSALSGDGRGKREGVYASCAMDLRRLVNRTPAAPVGGELDTAAASLTDWSNKTVGEIAAHYRETSLRVYAHDLLTTEAGAVLVSWLPGFDEPIGWWATDDRAAFEVSLVSCAIDMRRAQTDPDDEQPTDHEISREFRAAVRIEAVKP